MDSIPAHIPRSLTSYLEQYREHPDKAIERLEKHLKKRGPDAVGYYLLSWFYHHRDQHSKAVESAWKAKIFAPGSPVLEQFHYFLSHPEKFRAWKPVKPVLRRPYKKREMNRNHPISDLDALISKLSSAECKKIKLDPDAEAGPDLSEDSASVEDIVTETLAGIHEKQGNKKAAIDIYQRLSGIHTHKKGYYREQIRRLQEDSKD